MRFVIKVLISLCVIIFCTQIGRKLPTVAGLIAVMPLTGAIVLVWLYWDNPGNFELMAGYTKAALLGILPSMLFFVVAYICFRKHLGLWLVLGVSFAAWLLVAAVHFWLLHE
ncbi:MAG: DUF3147 family protein [Planctomycetota bacterium]|jgi:uncharacterized membrane protein (GlpM family)